MALLKQANAMVIHPRVSGRGWNKIRQAAKQNLHATDLTEQARTILGGSLDPDQYLFTHCTIVASVDVENAPGVKLGKVRLGSKTINRRFANYFIKPSSNQYVNNNGDSWSREVLRKSFHTFIGGHNFQEHVQLEEKSKGRILDAVSRDIGDSLYIDILVATNRVHTKLVKDILAQDMTTLSMGCFMPGTMVSLADGTRIPIEEVQPGDAVLTHKGRAGQVANLQIRHRDWSMRRIRSVGLAQDLVATDTHPFFVYRAPRICACGCAEELAKSKTLTGQMSRRFKVGHDKRIFNPNANYTPEEAQSRRARLDSLFTIDLEEVPAGELRKGDFLVFPRASRGEDDKGPTEGKARLLGYFLAEGSYRKDGRGIRDAVEFSFSATEEHTYAAEVYRLLHQEFPNHLSICRGGRGTTSWVRISDRDVAAWFYKYGGEYSHQKLLNAEVLRWPTEMQKHLVATWVSGDGWLDSSSGATGVVTTSYDLYCQMHFIMSRCGAFARANGHVATDVSQVNHKGQVCPYRHPDSGKLAAYTLILGQTQAQVFRGYTDKVIEKPRFRRQDCRVNDDYVLFPITSIETQPFSGFVYDLEVEGDHSYVVEGVAVHNCTTDFTICSKCGHVAADETELCDCVRYEKLNTFIDDQGQKRVVAELCGHESVGDTGGVRFIEASWVGTPAFQGAVLRNILALKDTDHAESEIRKMLASPAPSANWSEGAMLKAASTSRIAGEFGEDEPPEAAPAPAAKAPFQDLEDSVYKSISDRVRQRIEKDLTPTPAEPPKADSPNDTIIKEGKPKLSSFDAQTYKRTMFAACDAAASDVAFVNAAAEINDAFGFKASRDLYRLALNTGPIVDPIVYVATCRKHATRSLSDTDVRFLIRLGSLLTRWEGRNKLSQRPSQE